MAEGRVTTPAPPRPVERSAMSPISQQPGPNGPNPRIPWPAGVIPPGGSN